MNKRDKTYLRLAGCIVNGDANGAEALLEREGADVEGFNLFAWNNHIAGTLYAILSRSELRAVFPEELLTRLKPSYLEQWTKNEKLLGEIRSLSQSFEGEGIEIIFLKGPFLAERFYGDIDRRAISDIDLLIKKSELWDVDRLLGGRGYARMSYVLPSPGLSIYFTHHFEYQRAEVPLDLHWSLSPHFTYRIDYQRLWDEKRVYEFGGRKYYVLSDEYELLFQVLSILRDTELGSITLKSYVDAYMILTRVYEETNWDEFFTARRKERTYRIALNVLDLLLSLLDCGGEFPHIAALIGQDSKSIAAKGFDRKLELLKSSGFSPGNKIWALGLYDTSPVYSILWWTASLPFKLPVYRQSSSKLFRRKP